MNKEEKMFEHQSFKDEIGTIFFKEFFLDEYDYKFIDPITQEEDYCNKQQMIDWGVKVQEILS